MLCRKPENDFECEHVIKLETLKKLPSKKKILKAKPISEEEYKRIKEQENDKSPFGLVRRIVNQVFGNIQLKSSEQ